MTDPGCSAIVGYEGDELVDDDAYGDYICVGDPIVCGKPAVASLDGRPFCEECHERELKQRRLIESVMRGVRA